MNTINSLLKKLKSRYPLSLQILFTVLAFSAMALLSYLFMRDIVHRNLIRNAESVFNFAQIQLESELLEPRTMLSSFSQTIRGMLIRGYGEDAIRAYINEISDYMRSGGTQVTSANSFYGYFEKLQDKPVFMAGSGHTPPENFDPTSRPWYTLAIEAGGEIIETPPFISHVTGNRIISYTRSIYDDSGLYLGVTCLNVRIEDIGEKIVNIALGQGGYGMLLGQDLTIIAHANPEFTGLDVRDPLVPVSSHAEELLNCGNFLELPMTNWKGEKTIAFFRKISNGWYLGLLTPKIPFYKSITYMGFALCLLGATLAAALIGILIRTDKAKNKSVMENRHKSAFLANMSHEIRTPLNAIIGMTTLGKASVKNDRKDYCFSKISDASVHLLSVINDILDMSKIAANKFAISPAEFDFKKMIKSVVSVSHFKLRGKNQKFSLHMDRAIPKILIGDDNRIIQVITNLLANAIKFTPEHGCIKLNAFLENEENGLCTILFSVSDTGIGIDAKQQERIFNSFEQAESSTTRKYGGTGLGLSISKSIVELMGGKIWVQSEHGKGSIFYFTVKMKRGNETSEKIFASGANNSGARKAGKTRQPIEGIYEGKRVLLTEDVKINREIVQALLEPTAIDIDCAENGEKAVQLYSKAPENYDIILMDLQMPEMDGYEATRQIRAIEEKMEKNPERRVPIVAMSANVFREDVEKCFEAGMNSHVGKPLDMNELMDVISLYLFQRESADT